MPVTHTYLFNFSVDEPLLVLCLGFLAVPPEKAIKPLALEKPRQFRLWKQQRVCPADPGFHERQYYVKTTQLKAVYLKIFTAKLNLSSSLCFARGFLSSRKHSFPVKASYFILPHPSYSYTSFLSNWGTEMPCCCSRPHSVLENAQRRRSLEVPPTMANTLTLNVLKNCVKPMAAQLIPPWSSPHSAAKHQWRNVLCSDI